MLEGLVSFLLLTSVAVSEPVRTAQIVPPPSLLQIVAPNHPHFMADAMEVARARRQFRAFFSERNAQRFEQAFGMLTDTMQDEVSLADWSESTGRTLALFGATADQSVVRTTWYVDPPSAPLPGHYIAFDFQGETAGAARYCGFVVFHRQDNGEFRITAMEENFIARENDSSAPENISAQAIALPCYAPTSNDLL
jgi:hypothetical protein